MVLCDVTGELVSGIVFETPGCDVDGGGLVTFISRTTYTRSWSLMVRSKTPLVFTMSLFDTMTISKRLRDVKVTLVGLSINWWAFTEVQKDQRASLLGVLSIKSQFASPVSTMSLLRDKTFTYVGMSSFSRQEKPMSGGL